MANIDSKTLFLTTSPRTPEKMIPEIELLVRNFNDKPWTHDTQCAFMEVLRNEQFFNGKGRNDPALSARDRITRAPKSLGFVSLRPCIALTPAGKALLTSRRKDEVFLRQMLKFQVPSPYHKPTAKATTFCVKPYLEMIRLVRTMGTLKFDELQIFGMQLTDWHNFNAIVKKIERFRTDKLKSTESYRTFKANYLRNELLAIFNDRIARGDTKTRESADDSLAKFLATQAQNMRDYADACFRYLRATGLVNVSYVGKSLSIATERIEDVDFLLRTIERTPTTFDTEKAYVDYLGDATTPQLLTDDREKLKERIRSVFPDSVLEKELDIEQLKDLLSDNIEARKAEIMRKQIVDIKDYKQYDDIQNTFSQIAANSLYDAPLMLEWNTWRAMTMLDGGDIRANLHFDDFGKPLSTAQGNMADIVCDYGDFVVTVEVTLTSGQRQYEMESEPVSRHLGKIKKSTGKPCYCLFVSPTINEACVAHFFVLHNLNISYYGGKSVIVPLPMDVFRKMLEDSFKARYTPSPTHIKQFFEKSVVLANNCKDEKEWFEKIKEEACNWL